MTRAVGQTMARLADWQVATLTHRVEQLESAEAAGSRIGSAMRIAEQVGEPFEKMLIYSWRRHLAAAVSRVEALGANDEDLHTTQVTVGFADLVSFTALSNEMDEDRLADMVEIFESRCADVVAAKHGRVIKTLGDSVLFVSEDPVRGLDIAHNIVEVIGKDSRLPDVRLGLSTGSVIMRLGDVFGPPVNMAARLTSVARRNRVITDHATAALLPPNGSTPAPSGAAGARLRGDGAGRRTPHLRPRPAWSQRSRPGLTPTSQTLLIRERCPFCLFTLAECSVFRGWTWTKSRRVWRDGVEIRMSNKEFDLLHALINGRGNRHA